MAFKDYMNRRKADLEDIRKQVEESKDKVSYDKDPDDWYPGVDKAGNGLAVVRLMPALETEPNIRWVRWFSHSFKNPENNRWYIENSRTTFGFKDNPDPCAEFNNKLWNVSEDKNSPTRKQAQRQSRKFNLRVNVLIISDSANPSNNGTIKKWVMGKSFWNEIESALSPPVIEGAIEQEEPMNPFDLIDGKNFRIKIGVKTVDGKATRDYKLSWGEAGPVFMDHERINALYDLYNSEPERWSLLTYIAPDKFKSYEDLKKRLIYVLGYDPFDNQVVHETTKTSSYKREPLREEAPKTSREALPVEEKETFDFDKLKEDEEDEPWA